MTLQAELHINGMTYDYGFIQIILQGRKDSAVVDQCLIGNKTFHEHCSFKEILNLSGICVPFIVILFRYIIR